MSRIGVLGAGTWGISLARMLTICHHDVTVWSALENEITELSETHRHKNLQDMIIPSETKFTLSISEVCKDKEVVLCAVPSEFVRQTIKKIIPYLEKNTIIVSVAKGIEADTHYTMTQVIRDELNHNSVENINIAALSGPTHAEEVAKDLPTTIVSACNILSVAEKVQNIFMNSNFRVYTNTDVEGVELCGAIKNIIAIAVGISRGLGFGDNAKAAIITRGLSELTKLGMAMGCCEDTFNGLSGIGDLIVTATSEHSRNNRCGYLIGKGMTPVEAVKNIGMVVEGINAIPAAMQLSKLYKIEMPIIEMVDRIINHGFDPLLGAKELMKREKVTENNGVGIVNYDYSLLKRRYGSGMKRIITYGTYDLLHYGHINLLRRAKALGDYLIVVLSTDEFNRDAKHKKTYFTYEQRKQLLESVRYVDLVVPESSWEQKREDVHKYQVDTFVMGDDWVGKFDFLREEGVEVIYLQRTPEISTSQMKKDLHDNKDDLKESKLSHDDINTNL